jgi:hypothetical protein
MCAGTATVTVMAGISTAATASSTNAAPSNAHRGDYYFMF